MRAIIMADGKATRWGHYRKTMEQVWGTTHKQLLPVDGEPILHRTVRLLKENSVDDIYITSHFLEMEVEGATRYEPENNQEEIDKFYANKPIWSDDTLFVYGDAFFTEDAMKKIVSNPIKYEKYQQLRHPIPDTPLEGREQFLFFGRFQVSYFTGHSAEIFAIRVLDHDYFEKCCQIIRELRLARKCRGGAWELYRQMCHAENISFHLPYWNFISIDDFTDDFDSPEDYTNWLELYAEYNKAV